MDSEKKVSGKEDQSANDYNPYEHRVVAKPTSDIRAFANLLKSSLGNGILAIPLAFANSGWGVGIVGTIIIGFICTHCVHIFVKTSQGCCKLDRKPLMGYAETCTSAFSNGPKSVRPFAKAVGVFVELALLCTYLGVCCIFTILISDSVKQLLDKYYPVAILRVEYYCLILMIPLCLIVQIRHLKYLAPASLAANILLFSTFLICLYYIFKDNISFNDRDVVGRAARFPAFLSTVIFAMEGIGVVMPVENGMKKPHHFLGCPSVLVVAMSFITVLYTVLGLFGYFRYGNELKGSITLNLPLDDGPAICAKCFIAISIFLTYPLHFFVVIDIVTRNAEQRVKENYRNIAQIVVRCCIVIFCAGIALALPLLEQIINIVGALFYSTLGLIIPSVVETVFRWENLGRYNWILWKNMLLAIFGICCLVSGCLVTVFDIIDIMSKKTE